MHLQVLFGIGEKVQDLKSNVDQAAKTKDDAAEQVTPESPGSSQESNAEKVRQQAGECFAERFQMVLRASTRQTKLLWGDAGDGLFSASYATTLLGLTPVSCRAAENGPTSGGDARAPTN